MVEVKEQTQVDHYNLDNQSVHKGQPQAALPDLLEYSSPVCVAHQGVHCGRQVAPQAINPTGIPSSPKHVVQASLAIHQPQPPMPVQSPVALATIHLQQVSTIQYVMSHNMNQSLTLPSYNKSMGFQQYKNVALLVAKCYRGQCTMVTRNAFGDLEFNAAMTPDKAEILFLSTIKSLPKDHDVLHTIDSASGNGYDL